MYHLKNKFQKVHKLRVAMANWSWEMFPRKYLNYCYCLISHVQFLTYGVFLVQSLFPFLCSHVQFTLFLNTHKVQYSLYSECISKITHIFSDTF